jgi:putative Mg2+ transporter-C (MgtC) family protein
MMAEPFSDYIIRLLTALLLGGIVGLERELKGKAAGMRTNMLMCIGSCMIMIISIELARSYGGVADPGRIAAQAVTGIGFLGAGAIIRSKFHVAGLTTAATIWVLSALGLAIGAGYILLSIVVALLITLILTFISYAESAITKRRSLHIIQLALAERKGIVGSVLELFTEMKIISEALEVNHSGEQWTATFEYTAPLEKHHELVEKLSRLEGVNDLTEL